MGYFVHQRSLTESWHEVSESTISVYKAIVTVGNITDEVDLRATPVILYSDTLIYYPSYIKQHSTGQDAIRELGA